MSHAGDRHDPKKPSPPEKKVQRAALGHIIETYETEMRTHLSKSHNSTRATGNVNVWVISPEK